MSILSETKNISEYHLTPSPVRGMIVAMSSTEITEVTPVASSGGEIIAEAVFNEPLTLEEDTFALAFVEHGGNGRRAWRDAHPDDQNYAISTLPQARLMLQKANVALRIKSLQSIDDEHVIISRGSHLIQLAQIRDTAMDRGETKVALNAEIARGEAAGLYESKIKGGKGGGNNVGVTFVINSKSDVAI